MLLQTQRLMVRRLHESDAPALAAYRSDPEIARYQSWSAPVSLEEARALIHEAGTRDMQIPGWSQYAIELRADHTLIGDIGVNLHKNGMQAEIGFTLAAEYQGSGYATETIRHLLEHLFAIHGLHRVSAECDARNLRCARLLERLRFRREGYRVANTWLKGEWTDDLLFGLLSGDWRQTATPRGRLPPTPITAHRDPSRGSRHLRPLHATTRNAVVIELGAPTPTKASLHTASARSSGLATMTATAA